MHAQLRQFVHAHLGAHSVESETPWGYRGSYVAKLADAHHRRWYLKVLPDRGRFGAELTAYQRWTPWLGERAPELHGYDVELGALIISAVPGESAMEYADDAAVFRDAGVVLQRLHGSAMLPRIKVGQRKLADFDRLAWQAGFAFEWRTLHRARAILRELQGIRTQRQVPCHHDYSPRNWLVHKEKVHVIDFELAGADVWVADLARLHLGWWWRDRPELEEAFHDGYGRWPTEDEEALLRGCCIVNTILASVVGRLRRDESFEASSRERLVELTA